MNSLSSLSPDLRFHFNAHLHLVSKSSEARFNRQRSPGFANPDFERPRTCIPSFVPFTGLGDVAILNALLFTTCWIGSALSIEVRCNWRGDMAWVGSTQVCANPELARRSQVLKRRTDPVLWRVARVPSIVRVRYFIHRLRINHNVLLGGLFDR